MGLASVCGRRRQLVEGLFFTGAGSARTRQRREKRMMQRVAEGAVVDREQSCGRVDAGVLVGYTALARQRLTDWLR